MVRHENMRNSDLLAVRAYVTAQDTTTTLHADTVLVDVTHSNLEQRHVEIRIDKHTPLTEIYHLIHRKTGSLVDDQVLELYEQECRSGQLPVYGTADAQRPFAYFLSVSASTGIRIHCTDGNPHSISANRALENTDLVEKYVMSDEDYNRRTQGTLRAWSREQQRMDPTFSLAKHAKMHQAKQEAVRCHRLGLPLPEGFVVNENGQVEFHQEAEETNNNFDDLTSVQHCRVGDRCEIQPGKRRGRVAWVGTIPDGGESESYWVGVVLDEPIGQNDGTFSKTGKRYFDAPEKYGAFCRGRNVEVGDFPERDIFASDDEDEL